MSLNPISSQSFTVYLFIIMCVCSCRPRPRHPYVSCLRALAAARAAEALRRLVAVELRAVVQLKGRGGEGWRSGEGRALLDDRLRIFWCVPCPISHPSPMSHVHVRVGGTLKPYLYQLGQPSATTNTDRERDFFRVVCLDRSFAAAAHTDRRSLSLSLSLSLSDRTDRQTGGREPGTPPPSLEAPQKPT